MVDKDPLISVVMATYNREKFLPYAIESILNQTFTDFEFVIINDGSTDNSAKILKDYQGKDDRIKVFYQENAGPAVARNLGVQHARGTYIACMDDDDTCAPERLEKQLHYLQTHPQYAACICSAYWVDENRKPLKKLVYREDGLPTEPSILKDVPHPGLILGGYSLIKKSALQEVGGYRPFYGSSEDYEFTLRFQEKFSAGRMLECLYYARSRKTKRYDARSTKFVLKNVLWRTAARISAWHRRNGRQDPIEYITSCEEIMKFIPVLSYNCRHILLHDYLGMTHAENVFAGHQRIELADALVLLRMLTLLQIRGALYTFLRTKYRLAKYFFCKKQWRELFFVLTLANLKAVTMLPLRYQEKEK